MKLSPSRINFGRVSRRGPAKTNKVVITKGDGGPIAPKLLPLDRPHFTAELHEIEPGERYELEVTMAPPFKTNHLRGSVKLETGIPDAPISTITVYGTVAPRVASKPRYFDVPKKRDADWKQSVRLVWDDEGKHRILGATVNDPDLKVWVNEEGDQQQIVLQVPSDYKSASGRRFVTVQTDDTESPTVQVPITIRRAPTMARGKRSTKGRPTDRSATVLKPKIKRTRGAVTKIDAGQRETAGQKVTKTKVEHSGATQQGQSAKPEKTKPSGSSPNDSP